MNAISREELINQAFVKVADTLMDSYDVVDLLSTLVHQCAELLDAAGGGILIADSTGVLELIASTSEAAEFVEVMQLAAGEGPCVDCFNSGQAVAVNDIGEAGDQWAQFREAALQRGFHSLHATPMRLRGRVIGTMNLLFTREGPMSERDASLAQALADVAVIGILQERSLRDPRIVTEQLHLAIDTRIMVEQAKGVLSHIHLMDMDEAFNALRTYARSQRLSLREVSQGVVDHSLDPAKLVLPA
ncbi:MAG: transcriptional regulator [Glaciihabitans sp.]|nr:transcriptional regulator [Glaciihabitans sp.]